MFTDEGFSPRVLTMQLLAQAGWDTSAGLWSTLDLMCSQGVGSLYTTEGDALPTTPVSNSIP